LDFIPGVISTGAERRSATAEVQKQQHDKTAKNLPLLFKDQHVLIQNPLSLRWEQRGRIVDVRETGRSFYIETKPGQQPILRNRRFLRLIDEIPTQQDHEIPAGNEAVLDQVAPIPKKKKNQRKKASIPGQPTRRSKRLASLNQQKEG